MRRVLPEAAVQLDTFFRTGVVENTCKDGVCKYAPVGCDDAPAPADPCAE
jgi:hypothetical protein